MSENVRSRLVDAVFDYLAAGEIHACLFDWNGTFADSAEANYQAISYAVAQEGIDLARDWYTEHSGVSTQEMLRVLLSPWSSKTRVEELIAIRDDVFAAYEDTVRPFADAVEAVALCRGTNTKTAVASGGSRSIIESHLNK